MRNSSKFGRFFWLVALVAITVSSAVYPKQLFALVPSWNEASCVEQFGSSGFTSIWAAKIYDVGTPYVLISGETGGVYDIYRSNWTGLSWSPPFPVNSLSTGQQDLDVVIVGNKAYTVVAGPNNIKICEWNEAMGTASNCVPKTGGSDSARSLNYHDDFMYYSGVDSSVKKFDMSFDPWQSSPEGPVIWDSYGVYMSNEFAVVAAGCYEGVPPYSCLPAISRLFIYGMPGWTGAAMLPFSQHTKLASPFVSPDGKLWFVATPNASPETRRLYSCDPACGDGYCSGSADCPADCGCVPTTCLELGYECGTVDDGCGLPLNCDSCVNPEDSCLDATHRIFYPSLPSCNNHLCQYLSNEVSCPYGCDNGSGSCLDCVLDPNYCAGKECGDVTDNCGGIQSCGDCTLPETCNSEGQCVSGCVSSHPNVSLVSSGCELTYCGSNPNDPVTIKNLPGETCTFSMDVKHNGTPAAQITMVDICTGAGCIQSTFECEGAVCGIAYGDVSVLDNGQGITVTPSGEDVTTGIVGTNYRVKRYLESAHNIFEAACTLGHVWYTFHLSGGDLTVNLGTCTDCQEEVKVDLTTDEVIIPDPPDGDTDGGELDGGDVNGDAGDEEIDAGEIDGGDAEVIDGPDANDTNAETDGDIDGSDSPDKPDNDKVDGGTDTSESDNGGKGGGGCSTASNNNGSSGWITLVLGLIGLLFMSRRANQAPAKKSL